MLGTKCARLRPLKDSITNNREIKGWEDKYEETNRAPEVKSSIIKEKGKRDIKLIFLTNYSQEDSIKEFLAKDKGISQKSTSSTFRGISEALYFLGKRNIDLYFTVRYERLWEIIKSSIIVDLPSKHSINVCFMPNHISMS